MHASYGADFKGGILNKGLRRTTVGKRDELIHRWLQALASEDPVPGCFGGGNPESGERDGFSRHITRTEENEKALADMKFEARERKLTKHARWWGGVIPKLEKKNSAYGRARGPSRLETIKTQIQLKLSGASH